MVPILPQRRGFHINDMYGQLEQGMGGGLVFIPNRQFSLPPTKRVMYIEDVTNSSADTEVLYQFVDSLIILSHTMII